MAQVSCSPQTLKMLITALEQVGESDVQRALQAVIERRPPGQSSLDGKIVAQYDGVRFTQANLDETLFYNGQRLRRHPYGGGWVPADQNRDDPASPYVADTVYVGPFAMVLDDARLEDHVRVTDLARVIGAARLFGNAHILQHALVSDKVLVAGRAKVGGTARLFGQAAVYDLSLVEGYARVGDTARLSGHAWVHGTAEVGGTARLSGIFDVSSGSLMSGDHIK